MQDINKFSELQAGQLYSLFSQQFQVENKCVLICFDTTEMNRDISYWQYAERGLPRVTSSQLKEMFVQDRYPKNVFALWGHEIGNGYIVKQITREEVIELNNHS